MLLKYVDGFFLDMCLFIIVTRAGQTNFIDVRTWNKRRLCSLGTVPIWFRSMTGADWVCLNSTFY